MPLGVAVLIQGGALNADGVMQTWIAAVAYSLVSLLLLRFAATSRVPLSEPQ
jgi:hypothetical protein